MMTILRAFRAGAELRRGYLFTVSLGLPCTLYSRCSANKSPAVDYSTGTHEGIAGVCSLGVAEAGQAFGVEPEPGKCSVNEAIY